MTRKLYIRLFLVFVILPLQGCHVARATRKVVRVIGKAGWETAKAGGKVAWATGKLTGKAALATGRATSKGVRTVVYMARGKQIIPLEKQGNSLFANVRLNRKVMARFLLDTGASNVQISRGLARRLNIYSDTGKQIAVRIAGGHVVSGREVILKEVRLGRVRVANVKAIVFDEDRSESHEGLLGMSFLNHFIFQINTEKAELILQRQVE